MRPWTIALLLLLIGAPVWAGLRPGDHRLALEIDGGSRSFLVHVPSGIDGRTSIPVVIALHGGGSNGQTMARFSNLDATAEREGFVVVYPDGSGLLPRVLTWNGGSCCGYAKRRAIDDVAFISAMLDRLETVLPVDDRRVFVTGMSNGGIMAHRLACELSDRIAAVAPVSGTIGIEDCRPSRPVPVLSFHGTEDEFVRYEGGAGPKSILDVPFASVDDTVAGWVQRNGCHEDWTRVELPVRYDDGTRIIREDWTTCDGKATVALITVVGGGHTWPGEPSELRWLGPTTEELSANEVMWEFFRAHPLPETGSLR